MKNETDEALTKELANMLFTDEEGNIEHVDKKYSDFVCWFQAALSRSHAAGYAAGQREERERIEEVFKKEVPPHGMDLYDAVWLKRILSKAFPPQSHE